MQKHRVPAFVPQCSQSTPSPFFVSLFVVLFSRAQVLSSDWQPNATKSGESGHSLPKMSIGLAHLSTVDLYANEGKRENPACSCDSFMQCDTDLDAETNFSKTMYVDSWCVSGTECRTIIRCG